MSETLRELRDAGASRLDSRLEAELLIGHALGRDRAWVFAHLDDHPGGTDQRRAIEMLIERRAGGEPIAYILGTREFYGRDFQVGPGVLIPRPETELLVDIALSLPLPDLARVIDIGTGSGCVALTLATERPGWRVRGSDNSSDALEVARANREQFDLARVELVLADLLEDTQTRGFDLIVSNPPYVAPGDQYLASGDLRFEPPGALAAAGNGLAVIDALIAQAKDRLDHGGWLLIEHGHDQASEVRARLSNAGLVEISTHRDLAGIERAGLARRPSSTRSDTLG